MSGLLVRYAEGGTQLAEQNHVILAPHTQPSLTMILVPLVAYSRQPTTPNPAPPSSPPPHTDTDTSIRAATSISASLTLAAPLRTRGIVTMRNASKMARPAGKEY